MNPGKVLSLNLEKADANLEDELNLGKGCR